jgi:hypothetical protein
MKSQKIYTPSQFAKKMKLSRATIWRWLTQKEQEKRLKMYDARKIEIAGKTFITTEPLN